MKRWPRLRTYSLGHCCSRSIRRQHIILRCVFCAMPAELTCRLRQFQPKPKPTQYLASRFPNPVGLAAGFDKSGVALPAWAALGFGFAEIGTVTAKAQPGNPRPRIFRFPEQEALINRLGFNNDGAEVVAARLAAFARFGGRWPRIPIGINIGKSKATPLEAAVEDYLFSFRKLGSFADYVALNVSSPNTPGLRALQGKEALVKFVRRNRRTKRREKTGIIEDRAGFVGGRNSSRS